MGKKEVKEITNYIYGLRRNGEIVDQTSIDEMDKAFAKELFYKDFGHKKKKGDKIELLDTYLEDVEVF